MKENPQTTEKCRKYVVQVMGLANKKHPSPVSKSFVCSKTAFDLLTSYQVNPCIGRKCSPIEYIFPASSFKQGCVFLDEHQVLGFLKPCVSSAHLKCALFPPLAPENLTQTGLLYVLQRLLIIITLNTLSRNQALPPEFNFNIFLHSLYILNLLLKYIVPLRMGLHFMLLILSQIAIFSYTIHANIND